MTRVTIQDSDGAVVAQVAVNKIGGFDFKIPPGGTIKVKRENGKTVTLREVQRVNQ